MFIRPPTFGAAIQAKAQDRRVKGLENPQYVPSMVSDRRVKGYQVRGEEMAEELNKALYQLGQTEQRNQHLESVRAKMAQNVNVDPRTLQAALSSLEDTINEGVNHIMEDGETQFIRSLVDPFNAQCKGVRVPTMHPQDTFTHYSFETFSLSTAGFNDRGKILLFFNPTAIRAAPMLIVRDPLGELNSLDAPAPFIKQYK